MVPEIRERQQQRRMGQKEIEAMGWTTLNSEAKKCRQALELYDCIEGLDDEIGLRFCDLNDLGIDIYRHCEASLEFMDNMFMLRGETHRYLAELEVEKGKRGAWKNKPVE